MEAVLRPWFKRPSCLVGVAFLLLLLAGLGWFGVNVVHYMGLIKAGVANPVDHEIKQKGIAQIFDADSTHVPTSTVEAPLGSTPTLGEPTAKVHVIEFADFGCPFCKQEVPTIEAFMQRHAKDVFYEFRDYPLTDIHPDAAESAIAARCVFLSGGNAKFWPYHDRLYATQGQHDTASLRLYAQQAGVDLAAYDACIVNTKTQQDVEASLQAGASAGIEGTPTFFFNGVRLGGAIDDEALEIAFSEALKRAK